MKRLEFEMNDQFKTLDREMELNMKIKPHPNILKLVKTYKWEIKGKGKKTFHFRRYLFELAEADLNDCIEERIPK